MKPQKQSHRLNHKQAEPRRAQLMPIKLKEVKRHIKLIERRQEQPFKIVITFSRNGLITRQEVHSVKDFVYLYFDLMYNNNGIINLYIEETNKDD